MKTKRFKKFMTVALAVTMLFGSTVAVFAEEVEAGTPGVQVGEGTYEGGEMKYPTLSVTLPTIPEGTYDYIADPNGLISTTAAAHYDGATFSGTTGIFFKSIDAEGENKATYSERSKALTLTNENAQDIDVTIKLEQKSAGTEGIVYSDIATFDSTDTAQKLYLAVTDGAVSDAKTSALSSTKAATLTTLVKGTKGNYKANYDQSTGYQYVLDETKKQDGNYVWESCSYNLTGALNKNAEWGDSLEFPQIQVTWSYTEHQDEPSLATTVYTKDVNNTPIEVKVDNLGDDTISEVSTNGSALDSSFVTISGNKITLSSSLLSYVTSTSEFKIMLTSGKEFTFTVSVASE